MAIRPITVRQVNEYISQVLRSDVNLRNVRVVGEISGLSSRGGHIYFDLKDDQYKVSCAVWRSARTGIDESILENGQKIVATCSISPYPQGGSYKLSVWNVEPAGLGDYMAEFLRVKALLEAEGLFDVSHKRPLPAFPHLIGVITSSEGAAVEDIKKIITSKNDFVDILIFNVLVQGKNAPESIIQGIRKANEYSRNKRKIDVLIVGRGGGSQEDLAAFNDEGVARAVFTSEIPVISAVGHESDTSISDFVADVRAETPTAAADLAVPDTFALRQHLDELTVNLSAQLSFAEQRAEMHYQSLRKQLFRLTEAKIREYQLRVRQQQIQLREANPEHILKKGYAMVRHEDRLITRAGDTEKGDRYQVQFIDGSISVIRE